MSKKEEFMSHYWVEERHEFIKNLGEEEQVKLLDSLSDSDIDLNVNVRKFQEDYIADYLSDLFHISKTSFLKHIKMMFRGKGVLWSDNMEYVTFIKNEEIDNELLGLILESYLKEEVEFAKEVLEDIIASQLEYETNRNIIEQWIEDGGIEVKEAIMDIIEKVENDEWSDRFHY